MACIDIAVVGKRPPAAKKTQLLHFAPPVVKDNNQKKMNIGLDNGSKL